MRISRALFYLTFNGVYQNTNGIGRQTATITGTDGRHWSDIRDEFGPSAFFVVTPAPYNTNIWGVSTDNARHIKSITEATDGKLFSVPVADDSIWSVETWRRLCAASADVIERELAT